MKKGKRTNSDDLLPEYDFSSMKGGVAAAFPTDAAANEALRAVLKASRVVERGRATTTRSAGGSGRR